MANCNLNFNMFTTKICVVIGVVFGGGQVWGHGMVMDPTNRASMWRFDSTAPANYDDNGNFCGGRAVQWELNKGRCGACGDDFRRPQPRPNENGGTYGRGQVAKTYSEGQVIQVSVLITANHKGWFQFSVCNLTNPQLPESEECFVDLNLANGNSAYKVPSDDTGYYPVDIKLPTGLVCERCVLRWQYNTGNSWGVCPGGDGKLGCGPQETFRTCSDISIV